MTTTTTWRDAPHGWHFETMLANHPKGEVIVEPDERTGALNGRGVAAPLAAALTARLVRRQQPGSRPTVAAWC